MRMNDSSLDIQLEIADINASTTFSPLQGSERLNLDPARLRAASDHYVKEPDT